MSHSEEYKGFRVTTMNRGNTYAYGYKVGSKPNLYISLDANLLENGSSSEIRSSLIFVNEKAVKKAIDKIIQNSPEYFI